MPSTAFCLLLRLLTLRSTTNQMTLMLNHKDSPYIRAIGFLYLRYNCDPDILFQWLDPYLYDDEPIQVRAKKAIAGHNRGGESKKGTDHTIGSFVRSLLSTTSRDYCGTILPRLPIQIERDIQVKLLQAEKMQTRAESHFRNKRTMEYFQKLASKVMATYEDEENPLQWYKAEVDRVILRGDDGNLLKYPKFVVTFTEYGNTETVTLGEMDLPDGNFHTEDDGRRGGVGGRCDNNLYDEIRRRERNTVTASGRDYCSRPPTTKCSLAGAGRRRRSPSPAGRCRSLPPRSGRSGRQTHHHSDSKGRDNPKSASKQPPERKRTSGKLAAIQEKKRRLMAKYG